MQHTNIRFPLGRLRYYQSFITKEETWLATGAFAPLHSYLVRTILPNLTTNLPHIPSNKYPLLEVDVDDNTVLYQYEVAFNIMSIG